MKTVAGKPGLVINPRAVPGEVPTLLSLHIKRGGEFAVEIDFSLAKFGVSEDGKQFYISARPEGNDRDRLTIRGLSLEAGVTYPIGDGDEEVHVSLDVQGITEYATDPVGTFTVHNVFKYPDGNTYLLGYFVFLMTETVGEKRDILVNCYTLQILEND